MLSYMRMPMLNAVHVLLVSCLLQCPVQCMGASGFAAAGEGQQPACSCCGHDSQGFPSGNTGNDSQPVSPGADCECTSCLCHGATEQPRVEALNPGIDEPYHSPCWLVPQASTWSALEPVIRNAWPSCPFPPLAGGRDICVLTCTLQL